MAFIAARSTSALLFGVTPTAPRVFVLSAGVLLATALLAALWPAKRAAAIDPVAVLK